MTSGPAAREIMNGPVAPSLCRMGAAVSFALLAYCVAAMFQVMILGAKPLTAAEAFTLLETNRLAGLLRLDVLTVFALPLYYPFFLALAAVLWQVDGGKAALSALLVFAGVTLVLATPTGLSMVPLSTKYAAAHDDTVRSQLLAAGEAILASDMWHGAGALMGGVLTQTGAVLISIVMSRGGAFSKSTGWLGVIAHGLDLAHALLSLFFLPMGGLLLVIAGPLYPIWFFLVGRRLLRMARTNG